MYKQASLTAEPTVLLDPNAYSDDGTVALSMVEFTEDAKLMAYGISASGSTGEITICILPWLYS